MESIVIQNRKDQMILTLKKKGFDEAYLISLVKRLQIEELAQKSKFKNDILGIADQINTEWWDQQGDKFLKGVKK
jgi:hypothetical protein